MVWWLYKLPRLHDLREPRREGFGRGHFEQVSAVDKPYLCRVSQVRIGAIKARREHPTDRDVAGLLHDARGLVCLEARRAHLPCTVGHDKNLKALRRPNILKGN